MSNESSPRQEGGECQQQYDNHVTAIFFRDQAARERAQLPAAVRIQQWVVGIGQAGAALEAEEPGQRRRQ
jgi:hypothetical protein